MTRILVTNDDGISSTGLHVLARTMRRHGDVVVVAPEIEYSGAGAGVGPLHLIKPQARSDDDRRHRRGVVHQRIAGAVHDVRPLRRVRPDRPRRVRHQSRRQRRARDLPLRHGRRGADGAQRRHQRRRRQPGGRRLRHRGPGLGRDDPRPALADRRRRRVGRRRRARRRAAGRAGRRQHQRAQPARSTRSSGWRHADGRGDPAAGHHLGAPRPDHRARRAATPSAWSTATRSSLRPRPTAGRSSATR